MRGEGVHQNMMRPPGVNGKIGDLFLNKNKGRGHLNRLEPSSKFWTINNDLLLLHGDTVLPWLTTCVVSIF